MKSVVEKHYQRLATSYDQFLYYSPQFVRTLTAKMIEKLRLQPDDRLVDLGCGTGMYSGDMLRQVPLKQPVLGVDPFAAMLAQIPPGVPVEPIAEDALTFSNRELTYDKVLIKETIHHVDDKQTLFANLHRHLSPGGVLLLVHVPPRVQYPLFEAALARCQKWHADPDELVTLLQAAGFQVERDSLDYEHALPKEHYFRMVAGQYMSVLSSFSDEELSQGLAEMEQRYANQSVLKFVDHFDYLTARKP